MTTAAPTKIVSATEMRNLEAAAVAAGTTTWRGLMERAARGVADVALEMLGAAPAPVLVLVGPGNNGGDALVVATHLHAAGHAVTLHIWKRTPTAHDWPWQQAVRQRLPMVMAERDRGQHALRALVADARLVVDGWLGSGVDRPLPPDLAALVAVVNARRAALVLAIDLPTGINADTGAAAGAAVCADVTVATGLWKRGHFQGAAQRAVGRLMLTTLDLEQGLDTIMADKLSTQAMRALLPARPADANKGTFGKVMVVGGSGQYPGAVFLAASGALRSGVGLVRVAVGRSIIGPLAASLHETPFLPLPEEDWGVLGPAAAQEVREHLAGYGALIIGPGLGSEEETHTFVRRLLGLETAKPHGVGFIKTLPNAAQRNNTNSVGFIRIASTAAAAPPSGEPTLPALLLDADALNILAATDDWHTHLAPGTVVLTPHPGEMARLLKLEGAAQINEDRVSHAQTAAAQWQQIVVLKGANTVIAHPDGRVAVGPEGNAALAVAGTGDVLSGLIGGLLAQGMEPWPAAQLGVWLHAAAGGKVRDELGDTGVTAGDLIARLPLVFRELRDRHDR